MAAQHCGYNYGFLTCITFPNMFVKKEEATMNESITDCYIKSPSHVFPKNPCLHSQSNPFVFGVHVPLCLQGDEWQKLNSVD